MVIQCASVGLLHVGKLLLIINPSNAEAILSKPQGCKHIWKQSRPCHVGIHWIALNEYSPVSTHEPGFQSFSSFFA